MDPMWLNRDLVDATIPGMDWGILEYDPDTGQYCVDGRPFTGVIKTRGKEGRLDSLGHLENGVECGVSVAWYPSGQIELYSEMQGDVYHGLHVEWDEDGTKRVEERYVEGVRVESP